MNTSIHQIYMKQSYYGKYSTDIIVTIGLFYYLFLYI